MSVDEGTTKREITTVTQEQYERWLEAAKKDGRTFSSWARVELDKAADKQLLQQEGA